ncbi:MAG TPA: fibronectin type III domain-containing protein [Candidatus Limnocylindria bacterium]|nr:fibronectin type III domain-containing protein [Candidatus Limnocylindria bacterium]
MSRARRYRLSLLTTVLGLTFILPSAVSAGAGWKTVEGRLVVAHGERYNADGSVTRWGAVDKLVTSSGEYALSFTGERPAGFANGAKVRVRGQAGNGTLHVGAAKADTQLVVAAAASTGPKKLAVLLLKFATTDPEPYTVSQTQQVIFSNANSVANYFAEESYGLMTVSGDVFGYFTISINTSACDYTDIGNKARAAATAAGVNLANYTQVQYVHNFLGACGWSGLAYVPGQDSWLNQALNLRVSSHELSHNFGVHHASTMSCTEGGVRVAVSANSANCSSSEYGDPFSVMGSASTRHTHNQQLASMGWITGGNLQTITSAGTYTIGAAENVNATSPRGVRIPRGNTGTWFYLELRQPFGSQFDNFGASDPAVTGVSIRISYDWTTIVQSQLLDTTPGTSSFSDAPLAVGQSFWDPLSQVTVTTTDVTNGVATVNVSWAADGVAPTTPGNLAVAATGTNTARLTWTASTDNVGVTGYEVRRDGILLGTVSTTQYDDSGLTPGSSYQYTVTARDAAGNASGAATRSWTQPTPDTIAPTAPSNLRTTSLTKAKATLAWNASTDAVGVAGYRIYRSGVLQATVTGLTWSQARQRTSSTYYVVAFDAAGNASGQSNNLVVPGK